MDWYYAINGQQLGPVDEQEFQRLASEGKIGRTDLVWNETMGDTWTQAHTVPGLFDGVSPMAEMIGAPWPVSGQAGGAGDTPNATLAWQAWQCLSGRWGMAIAVYVIYMFIMMGTGVLQNLSLIAALLLTPPFTLGLSRYYLRVARMQDADVGLLFSGFQRFGTALATYLTASILFVLWGIPAAVCFLISGGAGAEAGSGAGALFGLLALVLSILPIMAAFRYSQAFFILVDDASVSAGEAIQRSKDMMAGKKLKMFFLSLRFIGWWFLSALTCGLGSVIVWPYFTVTMARFYDDLVALPAATEAT